MTEMHKQTEKLGREIEDDKLNPLRSIPKESGINPFRSPEELNEWRNSRLDPTVESLNKRLIHLEETLQRWWDKLNAKKRKHKEKKRKKEKKHHKEWKKAEGNLGKILQSTTGSHAMSKLLFEKLLRDELHFESYPINEVDHPVTFHIKIKAEDLDEDTSEGCFFSAREITLLERFVGKEVRGRIEVFFDFD